MVASTLRFAELKKGMTARVVEVRENDDSLRLQELGLTRGAEFRVERVAPFGDPIEISLRGYRLCLRRREASAFDLELVP